MTQKKRNLRLVSPAGIAVYPKLNEPDTKFKAEGEYTCKLRFKDGSDEHKELIAALQPVFDEQHAAWAKDNPAKAKRAKKDDLCKVELDKEGEETGYVTFNFKMKARVEPKGKKAFEQKPTFFDAKKKVLDPPPIIWGGSTLKVAFEPLHYYVESSKACGLTLRLIAVQIIDLVSSGGGRTAESCGFEDEDGFEASGDEPTLNPKAPESGGSPDGDEDF